MSGSDGSSSGGGWTGGDDDDCSKVIVNAAVESPSTDELFVVGKMYSVQLVNENDVEIVQLVGNTGTVGAVRAVPPLLRCLRKGAAFEAEVQSANGGDIRVRVSALA